MSDSDAPKWLAWLHRNHSREELLGWTRSMSYFRFCRALGGHANDGDELVCALSSQNDADLVEISSALCIPVRELDPEARDAAERAGGPNRHGSQTQWRSRLAQPGQVVLAGVSVFVYVRATQTELSLSGAAGDPFEVTDLDVQNALRIEAVMGGVAHRVVHPPRPGAHCFSISERKTP
jgi:hypothetical protein